MSIEGQLRIGDGEGVNEHYVALPTRLVRYIDNVEYAGPSLRKAHEQNLDDARPEIVQHLRVVVQNVSGVRENEIETRVVLIEGPGGRGKSALKRSVVERLAQRFLDDVSEPLPVPCRSLTTDVVDDVCLALGHRYSFNRTVVEFELRMGMLIPVYEDIASAEVESTHFNAVGGVAQSLLLVTRPFARLRVELAASTNLLKVEPLAVDRANLPSLMRNYKAESVTDEMIEMFAEAFASGAGTFVPILIRLALHIPERTPLSLASVYRLTFNRLIKADGARASEVLDSVQEIVVRECWVQRAPYLDYADALEHKELLVSLRSAGVLVDRGGGGYGDEPRRVGFFHDSMRSFLIARYLQAGPGDWDAIELSARDPLLRETEIFDMAIAMAREANVGPELVDRLQRWFRTVGGYFSAMKVLEAVPTDVELDRTASDGDVSAMQALERALRALDVLSDKEGVLVGRSDLGQKSIRQLALFFKNLGAQVEELGDREVVARQPRLHQRDPRNDSSRCSEV